MDRGVTWTWETWDNENRVLSESVAIRGRKGEEEEGKGGGEKEKGGGEEEV